MSLSDQWVEKVGAQIVKAFEAAGFSMSGHPVGVFDGDEYLTSYRISEGVLAGTSAWIHVAFENDEEGLTITVRASAGFDVAEDAEYAWSVTYLGQYFAWDEFPERLSFLQEELLREVERAKTGSIAATFKLPDRKRRIQEMIAELKATGLME